MLRVASRAAYSAVRSSVSSQARFASTLVVAEHNNAALNDATLHAVTAAKALGDVSVLVAGSGCQAVADAAATVEGVSSVLLADDPAYENAIAENITNAVLACQEANSYSHIIAPATNSGKNFLPRVAVKLDVAPLSDVTAIEGEDTFERPTYAGNAMCTVKSSDSVKVMTVRTTAFEKAAVGGGSAAVEAAPAAAAADAGKASFVSEEKVVSDRPELTSARVVVAGGRGMKNGDNFDMLYEMADKLGGAVGASRAAVDAEFVANDLQIGQTGKVVAPELYIAVGISGAIQHLAGMKDSKVIACINKDPEAPIFAVSDVGLEADLFKAVPELNEKL